jgi:hypothetical protein
MDWMFILAMAIVILVTGLAINKSGSQVFDIDDHSN